MEYEPVEELLTPAEVAQMFRVSPKTVTRWARAGRISAVRTLGGHRRFRADEIRKLLAGVEGITATSSRATSGPALPSTAQTQDRARAKLVLAQTAHAPLRTQPADGGSS